MISGPIEPVSGPKAVPSAYQTILRNETGVSKTARRSGTVQGKIRP
jgi:hypothetical protein